MTVEVIKLKTICHYWLCSEVCSENYSVGGLSCEQRKRYPGKESQRIPNLQMHISILHQQLHCVAQSLSSSTLQLPRTQGHSLLFILEQYSAAFLFSHMVQETSTSQLCRQFLYPLAAAFYSTQKSCQHQDLWSCCTFTSGISRNSSISRLCCDFLKGKKK